ncbi:MAG: CusA/CzcA family heavy metal efflux RND transporter [Porphyromonadaceae bacterium]|nr:CusA/CzcA family heavy metal efflux RND transporter [Porphyromonadaceae bacterium]
MLNRIIRYSIDHKPLVGFMTLLLVVWGVWSMTRLPIDAVPDITNNQVQIITTCPSLASQEVEQLVTFPIEQSIANLPGLEEVRSISRFGLSVVTVVFDEGVDIYFARQLINECLPEAIEQMPQGAGAPELAPVSTGLGEVYQYVLRPKAEGEGKYSLEDLRTMQDWIVVRQLNGTPGVAEINSFGGKVKQYEVAVDPNRLRALGIGVSDIFEALEQNNENTGGAYIDKQPNAYFIRGIGMVGSLEDIGNINIKHTEQGQQLLVRDVARVQIGHATRYGALTLDGEEETVGGIVMMLKGENSGKFVERIKEKLVNIQRSLPEDVEIVPFLDRTELVDRAISTVETNLIEGALIVIFVLVLFLGNLRAGLIVASAIPLSMLFALGMMNLFGISANLMSLGAIDFGLIVDGSVIVVEATLHHIGLRAVKSRMTQTDMDEEVYESTKRIRSSATFGEIIILIVYIPILTLVGVEGKMFTPMAITVSFAIIGALILSLTYIPMMCALCLNKEPQAKRTVSDKMMDWLQKHYAPLLDRALKFKYWVIGAGVALFVGAIFIFRTLGGEFIPQLQEGDFAYHCILPQGTSLSQSIETSMQASRIMKSFPEVRMVVGKTGSAEVPTDPMPPEATDLMVILHNKKDWPDPDKSYDQLADEINHALAVIPGVFFEKNQPIQMRFNELMTGIRQDVAVKIFGENLDSLALYANRVSSIISSVPGVTAPQVERVHGLPQINVQYDRLRLSTYGITIGMANQALNTAFAGQAAGQVFENERRFDLVVRLDSTFRTDIEDVRNLPVPSHDGQLIPLSQVADIEYRPGPAQISREEGKRRIVVGFNVSGRDVQSVVDDIHERLDKVKLPMGYYFTYGGQFEHLQQATSRLLIAVPVSLLLIFTLLYFTFGSARWALLIFTAIPMSAIGGVLALLVRGMPFSISAGIGFIALFGVAVLNGIVLIGTFNELEKSGVDLLERIRRGATERLRPVLMTAAVASIGFLPMALSTGAGAEVQKPLATVVIGGLLSATLLTLFVLPLLYMLFSPAPKTAKHSRSSGGLMIAGLLLVSSPIYAQSEPQIKVATVDDAIALAMQYNSQIQSERTLLKATKAFRPTAFALPRLELSAETEQTTSRERDLSLEVSQRIPFPTVFVAKRGLLKTEEAHQEAVMNDAIRQILVQVRTAYAEAIYYHGRLGQMQRLDSLYSDFVRLTRANVESGESSPVELNTALIKQGKSRQDLARARTDLKQAYVHLASLLGVDAELDLGEQDSFAALPLPRRGLAGDITTHPELRAIALEAQVAKDKQRLELHESLPELTFGYTNKPLEAGHGIGQSSLSHGLRGEAWSIGVAIPLGWGSNRARIRSERMRHTALQLYYQQRSREMQAQLLSALADYQQKNAQCLYYQQEALPVAQSTLQAAQIAFATGEISYVEYLYTLETTTELELSALESVYELNQSIIQIYSYINQID